MEYIELDPEDEEYYLHYDFEEDGGTDEDCDPYQEGFDAFYAMEPNPSDYTDIDVICYDYSPGNVCHDVFYTGVRAAMKHYQSEL